MSSKIGELVATYTFNVKIPQDLCSRLEPILAAAAPCVTRMLVKRNESSSRDYPELPCVISKALVRKYQRDKKCKAVKRLTLPVCGDGGRQVKLTKTGFRVPAIFGKVEVSTSWPRPVSGHIRQVEFFRREGIWYGSICYNTPIDTAIQVVGAIGVDRNSVGNIAVIADPQTGKVRKLGICPARTKQVFRNRRKNLQASGKFALLKKLRRKQSRRMTYENHRASKAVVDYAATHRRAVVMERLENIRRKGSKIRRYAEINQWAFAQLGTMLRYKCALRGIPLIEVDPAYTSQMCSRCGSIHKPNSKHFKCLTCLHNDHRDANAAFNIASRGAGWSSDRLSVRSLGVIGAAQTGKERGRMPTLDDQNSGDISGNIKPTQRNTPGGEPVTETQRQLARQALGLPNEMRRSYDNFYRARPDGTDELQWLAMVQAGEAEKVPLVLGGYRLTQTGIAAALEDGEYGPSGGAA